MEDVEKLGKKFDVKEVADGYARNFLLTKNLAKIADEKTLKWAEEQRIILEKQAEEQLAKAGELASNLDGLEVEIPVKIGDQGQLFEKVNSQKIAKRLQEMGYNVKKNQVELAQDIEDLGEFDVLIKFEHNLEAQIKVIVMATEEGIAEKEETL